MFEGKLIVNALPVTDAERAQFIEAAHGMEQVFATDQAIRTQTSWKLDIPPIYRERATAVLGNVNKRTLAACPNIEWLHTNSAGIDSFLEPGILPAHTTIVSASGAYGPAVAEHMLTLTLAIMKHLQTYRIAQLAHSWTDAGPAQTLDGAQVYVLGTGDIGTRYAQICQALGAHTIGFNRSGHKSPHFDACYPLSSLGEKIASADVVALALPATDETFHLIGADLLAKMKTGAYLINAGRGSCIDTNALIDALGSHTIAGAALDVVEGEPLDVSSPLWDLDNLILTPHVAGGNHIAKTGDRIIKLAIKHLDEYVRSLM